MTPFEIALGVLVLVAAILGAIVELRSLSRAHPSDVAALNVKYDWLETRVAEIERWRKSQ